jgi:hypothetical protein
LLIVISKSPWVGNGNDLDTGFELGKLEKAPAIEGQIFDLHPADPAVYFVLSGVDTGEVALNFDALPNTCYMELEVDREIVSHQKHDATATRVES